MKETVVWTLDKSASKEDRQLYSLHKMAEKYVYKDKKKSHRWMNKESMVLSWSSGSGWKILDDEQQMLLKETEVDDAKSVPWAGKQRGASCVWSPKLQDWKSVPELECHNLSQKGVVCEIGFRVLIN